MDKSSSAIEIFRIAERIEEDGAIFYREAAQRFKGEAKKVLLNLAEMEEGHRVTFAAMGTALSGPNSPMEQIDPGGKDGQYLSDVFGSDLMTFSKGSPPRLTGQESAQEILKTAIDLEKDSLVFYVGMKTLMPDLDNREKIDRIITEEFNHISFLINVSTTLENR